MAICFTFEVHETRRAFSLDLAKAGKIMLAKMAIMAITTSNSISVKAPRGGLFLAFIRQRMANY
jgi:hypothetical protein